MSMQFSQFAAAADGTITSDDVLALRRLVWSDGAISADEAHAIIAINARVTAPSRAWSDFLVEALGVWLVDEQEPRGYVDEAQGRWLVATFAREDHPATSADIELLVHVLERAVKVPAELESFVLAQIEAAIRARPAPAGVSDDDVRALRRIVFAAGGEHTDGVSQGEAELLFRIKDAMLGRDNVAGWQQLFVQGVGNFLQGYSLAKPLDRAREAELDAFMNRREPGLFGFLGAMAGGIRQAPAALGEMEQMGWHEHLFTDEARAAAVAAEVTPEEGDWLKRAIDADGVTDAYEQALLDFIRQG